MITLKNNINDIDFGSWNELVANSSYSTFFQTPQCYRFYESLSFMKPFVFSVYEDNILKGVIVGYIQQEKNSLKQFMTRRAIVPGGALLADDISEETLAELLLECKNELRKSAIYIELRNFNDYSAHRETFEKFGFVYHQHLNFHIDTSSEETIQENLGKSRKRDIKTSLRDGAEFVENPSLDDVKSFYKILHQLYTTKVKTPLFPYEFFEKMFISGLGIYRLVRYNGEIIGGTLCVGLEHRALYEWFACGKDGELKNIYPSTMATFAGMTYGAQNGYPLFDMMGAGKADEGYGVRDFKAKFGGKLVEHGRFLIVNHSFLYKIGELGVRILKSL